MNEILPASADLTTSGQNPEIVFYQPNETIRLEVRMENDTVWLTQAQMAELFGVKQPAISKHLQNIFNSHELEKQSVYSILEYTADDGKSYQTSFYNLDVVISVGYRVNSINATKFRQWATKVLRKHIINSSLCSTGCSMIQQIISHEQRLNDQQKQISLVLQGSFPQTEGILFEGQIFDAYVLVSDLVRSANERVILIDNYIDETVLTLLDKRADGVNATIYTQRISQQLQLDIDRHNAQYQPIEVKILTGVHDRFLVVDSTLYHIGASLKDLGKKLFAFCKMEMPAEELLSRL